MIGLVGATYLVLIAVDSRPIADDWWFISDAQRWSFDTYMHAGLDDSGRSSQFARAWVSAVIVSRSSPDSRATTACRESRRPGWVLSHVSSCAPALDPLNAAGIEYLWPVALDIRSRPENRTLFGDLRRQRLNCRFWHAHGTGRHQRCPGRRRDSERALEQVE
ncbi:MAG: hypothetical protein KGL16_13165 [Acidobacteriota bacterium]|nr:hypothetical protein [Acidobacteriota bacterium]